MLKEIAPPEGSVASGNLNSARKAPGPKSAGIADKIKEQKQSAAAASASNATGGKKQLGLVDFLN